MRTFLGILGVIALTVAIGGCDKETQAQESSTGDAVQQSAPQDTAAAAEKQSQAEGVPVAKPIEAPKAAPAEMAPDVVVVTVNGQPILNAAVTEEVTKRAEAMKGRMPEGQAMPEAQKQQIRMSVVDMLVQKEVLNQQLAKKNLTVTDDEVMAEIAKIAEAQGQTLDEVKAEIAEYGMTLDDLKSQVRPQVQMKKLAEASMNDEAMVAEAKTFYEENPSYFEVPEQVRASHVLIKIEPTATDEEKAAAKKEAEEVLAKAKAGEDFAALAKEYSDDPGSKDTGGEYTFGRGKMVKPFEDTAFALEPGQVSDLVETQFGYHIIKLSEKTEAGKTPFDEAKERIISFLIQKQMREGAAIEYSEAEQAMRQQVQQQQMMQQQMMQQIQQQMAEQQAQQAAEPATEEAAPAAEE